MSYNGWLYVYANPVNLTDPTGHDPWWCEGQPDEDLCLVNWIIGHGGPLTADILESIYTQYPDTTLLLLQRQYNIKLPANYHFQSTAGGTIFGQTYNDTFGVNWWFAEYNSMGNIIEISDYSCSLFSTNIPRQAIHIDYGIYITRRTFPYWDYKPDDIAGIMIHEAVHAWQESAARDHIIFPGVSGDPSSISWFYKYRNSMEVQAADYTLDANKLGRINMSNKLTLYFNIYKYLHVSIYSFPYTIPPDVP
jgi:hypothetical protein